MPNVCSVMFYKAGYQKRRNQQRTFPETYIVFFFSFKKPNLLNRWVKFCNRKYRTPGKNCGICAKYFEGKFLNTGMRTTLQWKLNSIPSIYSSASNLLPSVLSSITSRRKSPTKRELLDEISKFKSQDEIKSFSLIIENLCSSGLSAATSNKQSRILQNKKLPHK